MSAKKHYQKRNQELNKDLMKRWGYTPPEKPDPTQKPESTIDEGLFDSVKKKLGIGGDDPGPLTRTTAADYEKVRKDYMAKRGEQGKPAGGEESLLARGEKLKAFAKETLLDMEASGVAKDTDLYKKIEKALGDAHKVIAVTGPKELDKAIEQPSSVAPSEEVIEKNIAALEDWKTGGIQDAKDFLSLRRVLQSIKGDLGGTAVVSKSDTKITVDETINAINRIQAAIESAQKPTASDIAMITRNGGLKAKVDDLVKKATYDPDAPSGLELDTGGIEQAAGAPPRAPEPIDFGLNNKEKQNNV